MIHCELNSTFFYPHTDSLYSKAIITFIRLVSHFRIWRLVPKVCYVGIKSHESHTFATHNRPNTGLNRLFSQFGWSKGKGQNEAISVISRANCRHRHVHMQRQSNLSSEGRHNTQNANWRFPTFVCLLSSQFVFELQFVCVCRSSVPVCEVVITFELPIGQQQLLIYLAICLSFSTLFFHFNTCVCVCNWSADDDDDDDDRE